MPGGFEHVGLRAGALHETGNWHITTDCFNAFNAINKTTAVLAEVATGVPALTRLVGKYYGGEAPAGVLFQMDAGEHWTNLTLTW